jgi:hypothetical protein
MRRSRAGSKSRMKFTRAPLEKCEWCHKRAKGCMRVWRQTERGRASTCPRLANIIGGLE